MVCCTGTKHHRQHLSSHPHHLPLSHQNLRVSVLLRDKDHLLPILHLVVQFRQAPDIHQYYTQRWPSVHKADMGKSYALIHFVNVIFEKYR